MARPRTFEPDDVVGIAMAVFRQNGFRATSIRDLESATGLKAASIYKAFGNKSSLFVAALTQYRADVVARRIETHLRPENGLDGIRTFFSSTYTTEPDPGHGCMIANASLEADEFSDPAKVQLHLGLAEMRGALETQLEYCRGAGEVHSSVDTRLAAGTLLVLYQGQLGMMRTQDAHVEIDINFDNVVVAVLDQLKRNQTSQERTQ